MEDRISLLWASDGSDYCLSTASVLRELVLPVTDRLDVVTIAPLNGNIAGLKRLIGAGNDEQEQEKAEAAARATVETLGDVGMEVGEAVRWGPKAQEIVKEATQTESDMIMVGAKPFNAFRRAIMDDTALAVLKATHRHVLLARPTTFEEPYSMVLLCHSGQWLEQAVSLLRRLQLERKAKIYLASFSEPSGSGGGSLFFTYGEYRRLRSEVVALDRETRHALMSDASVALQAAGYETEIVVSEDSADQGLSRLVEEVSGAAVVMGATPYESGFFSSTADALDSALRTPCSVLVAR